MNNGHKKLSAHQIKENIDAHVSEISKEFKAGFEELKKNPKSVTIFGSSRFSPASRHYKEAQELAGRIVKELGYAVITGGGPGVMAAANLGASEAQGKSVGFTIELPHEQHTNPYVNSGINFEYFFARKVMLTFAAEAYVFFPGGFGTFDEFFSILTLLQTDKIPRVPMILVGEKFWTATRDYMKVNMLEKNGTISAADLDLFTITDDIEQVMKIIKKAQVSEWWKKMD
jgi:uncharacterized protein (TIGR00730 family)